jgi:hypothetical protein
LNLFSFGALRGSPEAAALRSAGYARPALRSPYNYSLALRRLSVASQPSLKINHRAKLLNPTLSRWLRALCALALKGEVEVKAKRPKQKRRVKCSLKP